MTGARTEREPRAGAGNGIRPGRELAALIALGAAGAGLMLLALRQDWARVTLLAPRPLPATVVPVAGQDLVPGAAALAVAMLASLAAVLATRRVPRRITGLISAGLGIWAAVLVAGPISDAGVLAAARRSAGRAGGTGSGGGAGSVTAGGVQAGAAGSGGPVPGFPAHVLLAATGWRGLALGGTLAVIGTGIAITLRAARLPVMAGRYDRHASAAAVKAAGGRARSGQPPSPAGMWDALTAGADPTVGPGSDSG